MNPLTVIFVAVGAILAVLSFFMWRKAKAELAEISEPTKKQKRKKTLRLGGIIVGLWIFTVELINLIFGPAPPKGEFEVEITPARVDLFGYSVSSTAIISTAIVLIVLVLALVFRFLLFPKFEEKPKSAFQVIMEFGVEWVDGYTDSKVENAPGSLGSYIFTVAVFMIASALTELFGLRAPTSDITVTFAMALFTFFLINFYGIRRKGLGGRIKSLASPTPMVLPIRMVCDCAVPVSLACRLFGNMLGGMIVMELLYYALGQAAIAVPSIVGLYFNVFHPLIQAFIFITLSLTFINEAVETAEQ